MSKYSTLYWFFHSLVGFTSERGKAWTYRADLSEKYEPNHYPGPIPVADVLRRLFSFEIVASDIWVPRNLTVNPLSDEEREIVASGNAEAIQELFGQVIENKQAFVRSDNKFAVGSTISPMGIHSESYAGPQYSEWCIKLAETLLDDDVSIGSAGLLDYGAKAWVSIEMSGNTQTPEGVEFRPHLLMATGFDGTLANTGKRCCQFTVCDNTFAVALSEKGQTIKIKHTKNAHLRIADAREALAIMMTTSDEMSAEIARLCAIEISPAQFGLVLDELVPMVEPVKLPSGKPNPKAGMPKDGRALTMAENKRDELRNLWVNDNRVSPWAGTAFGVIQMQNTWLHHVQGERKGIHRAERNMLRAIDGTTESSDLSALLAVEKVLSLA